MENVVIAGSGPAGLTAAIYTARGGLKPLVFEGLVPGGQLIVSDAVENYPGFFEAASGYDIMNRFRKHAERFGVRFRSGDIRTVIGRGKYFDLVTDEGVVSTKTLIIATGAEARRLDAPGESKFYGYGVSGCATCDGAFFRNKDVLVVGGGNTAIQDAIYLSALAAHVTVVHRRDFFRADFVDLEKARRISNIQWLIPWVVVGIGGDKVVDNAVVKNAKTGETQTVQCSGIFVAIGHDPKTSPFADVVQIDDNGYIRVSSKSTETTTPGVFACGDVCDPVYRQAAVAAGQGCMAAIDVQHYLRKDG